MTTAPRERMVQPGGVTPALPGPPRVIFLGLAAVLLLVNAWWLRHYMVDDAFISFRYAANIAGGLGPVFNAGERVEGFSNPLYTFLLAAVVKVLSTPDHLPGAARTIGIAASLGSLFLIARLPWGRSTWGPGLGVVLTATSAGFGLWAVAGLETPLYGFLVTAGVAATLARPSRPFTQVLTGLLLSALILSRPEGILPAGALFLVRLLDPETRRDGRGHLRTAVAMAAPALVYLGFRLVYFHDWLPNTWYAKKLPLDQAFPKGRWYLIQFVADNGGKWLYAATPFALLSREARRCVLVCGLVLAAYLPYILIVGGDWMGQHRFLAPILPLLFAITGTGIFAIVEPGVAWIERRTGALPVVRPALFLAAWLMLLVPTVPLIAKERREPYVNASPYYTTVGRAIGALTPRSCSVAAHDIGAIGWYGRRRVVDLLGLVDHDLARGAVDADGLIARELPEILILHYDNRPGAVERWRKPEIPGFDSLYVHPVTNPPLPGSFYVRSDRARFVANAMNDEGRDALARDLAHLDAFLEKRQPDGRSLTP